VPLKICINKSYVNKKSRFTHNKCCRYFFIYRSVRIWQAGWRGLTESIQISSFALNPFKKAVIKTECMVHKYINIQALEILKNDKYIDAYCLFSDYIDDLNKGVTWPIRI